MFKEFGFFIVKLLLFLSFGIVYIILDKYGKPFIKGFYCDDDSIRKPYHESTIPSSVLYAVSFFLVAICASAVEARQLYNEPQTPSLRRLWLSKKKFFVRFVVLLLIYLYGCGITMFLTAVGKYSVGRLRPNFFAVCDPDWPRMNCTDSNNNAVYIIGDQFCRGKDDELLREGRLSFPSGHSSMAAYTVTFLVWYLHYRLQFKDFQASTPKLAVQVLLITASFYVALSRISDNKHHPTDVLTGYLLGIFPALVVCYKIVNELVPYSNKEDSPYI